MNSQTPDLRGKVAVVAGATRGAGRGIARALGEAGATVYCTGRSARGQPSPQGRPETIEETAELVTKAGGEGRFVRVDHTRESEVRSLFDRVRSEQGCLDILVNDVWGGDVLTEWNKRFWELDLAKGFQMMDQAVRAHIITSRYGGALMIERDRGLIVEITDGDDAMNRYYRGTLFYDLVKVSAMRLALAMAGDLRDNRVTALCLTPGFLRSEAMLDHFGVTEATWRDAVRPGNEAFAYSETPLFVGRAVAALAADPWVAEKAGLSLSSWNLAKEYGFTDEDGTQPDIGSYFTNEMPQKWERIVHAVNDAYQARYGTAARVEANYDDLKLTIPVAIAENEYREFVARILIPELWMETPAKIASRFLTNFEKSQDPHQDSASQRSSQ